MKILNRNVTISLRLRGQPTSYDKWFMRYEIPKIQSIFAQKKRFQTPQTAWLGCYFLFFSPNSIQRLSKVSKNGLMNLPSSLLCLFNFIFILIFYLFLTILWFFVKNNLKKVDYIPRRSLQNLSVNLPSSHPGYYIAIFDGSSDLQVASKIDQQLTY